MSTQKKENVLFIVNPKSGKMAIKSKLFDIIKLFSDSDYECTVMMTKKTGDAVEYAKTYGRKFSRIISCGGDGTLNEIVTGLMEIPPEERASLGLIPVGTTNDLADTLKIPKTPLGAAKTIIECDAHPNDVGLFNKNKYFNYVASCGAFTSTSYSTPQNRKNSLGHLAYLLEGIKSLNDIKPIYMRISAPNISAEGDFVFAAITNALSVGGIYKFESKYVDLCDGMFEVILIRMPKNTTDLVDIISNLAYLNYDENQVLFFHTPELKIECEQPVNWTVDGEFGGSLESVTVKNLPGAIKIFKPE